MKTLLLAGALVVSPLPVAAQDATLAAKAAVALGLERSCGYALNARARLFAIRPCTTILGAPAHGR